MKKFLKSTAAVFLTALCISAFSCSGQSSEEASAVLTDGTTSYTFYNDGNWTCSCDSKTIAKGSYSGTTGKTSELNIYFEKIDNGSGLEACALSAVIQIKDGIYDDGDSVYTLN